MSSTNNIERRFSSSVGAELVEVRTDEKTGGNIAYGYAYRFGVYSSNLGGFVERVAPGAGAKSIAEADIRGLFNHDPNKVLGRTGSGTMTMAEDDTGGYYEIKLPDTPTGRELLVLLDRGDLSGSSFGFRTITDRWTETEQGYPLRTVEEFALIDVGPVTFPAYPDADSALRSLAEARSLDHSQVVDAANADSLASMLKGENRDSQTNTSTGRAQPTRRGRYGYLLG